MEDILVSVLCITYNQKKYIRQAIEGFVNQKTDFKFEVIIHDDASTDGTADIIREYAEKYPELIVPILQKENQYSKTQSIFLTYVIPHARGKYVAFCEGDDYWCDETKLQQQADVMEKNPEYSMCVHKVQCVNEDDTLNDRIIPEKYYNVTKTTCFSKEEFANILFETKGYPFHTSSYFIRKSVLDCQKDMLNKLYLLMNGDQIYMRASLMCGKIYYIDTAMSHRRLMSIGNWNSYYQSLNMKNKIKLFENNINGNLMFDKYSNGEFKDKIKVCITINILMWALYDVHKAKKMLNDFNIKYSDVKDKLNLKQKIKFVGCVHFTKILSLIKKQEEVD